MNEMVMAVVREVREAERRRAQDHLSMKMLQEDKIAQEQVFFSDHILPNVRLATTSEYTAWMEGYLLNGIRGVHAGIDRVQVRDYAMPGNVFYVATSDLQLIPLYGIMSVSLIVPVGISVQYEELGNNSLYYMEEFRYVGKGAIPLYKDMFNG